MTSKKLYVSNFPYSVAPQDLHQLFSQYGTVLRAQVCEDRETGQSRDFGFVEMNRRPGAQWTR